MRARFVFEKFTEDSDPIEDMGIGIQYQLEQWLEKNQHSWRRISINDTDEILSKLIYAETNEKHNKDNLDRFINFLLKSRSNYNKDDILQTCIGYNQYQFLDFLIERGAKFKDLSSKASYILHDGKLVSFTPEEEMLIACSDGNYSVFVKMINSGVKLKIGMISAAFKHDVIARYPPDKSEKEKILQFLRDHIDNLEDYIHPRDHKKIDKIKNLLSAKKSLDGKFYPTGYKLYRVLKYINENEVNSSRQIAKLVYELSYGKDTFNPILNGSYWSDSMEGVKSHTYTDDDGNWVLTDTAKLKLRKLEIKFKPQEAELNPYV
jgi:hypothetical protein